MALATTDLATVLVVEDAPEFRQLLDVVLTGEGYDVTVATDGTSAVTQAREIVPDVIVLDLGLPDIDGIEVCRQIRAFTDAYVIMLTARCDEIDRLLGLTTAADDYMTKPFSPRDLVARIQDLMERPRTVASAGSPIDAERVRVGEIEIDVEARGVSVDGDSVELTPIEFDLLATLARRPAMVFSRQMLLEHTWGEDWHGDHHLIDVHIANLRKKIDANGVAHIKTVRGVGYRIA